MSRKAANSCTRAPRNWVLRFDASVKALCLGTKQVARLVQRGPNRNSRSKTGIGTRCPVFCTAGECDESESAESDSGPDTAGVSRRPSPRRVRFSVRIRNKFQYHSRNKAQI